jgi:hypothetical protein
MLFELKPSIGIPEYGYNYRGNAKYTQTNHPCLFRVQMMPFAPPNHRSIHPILFVLMKIENVASFLFPSP